MGQNRTDQEPLPRAFVFPSPFAILRGLSTALFASLIALGWLGIASAQSPSDHAVVVRVDGLVNSVKERLIDRTLERAHGDNAALVIIELDTPGGLLDSTRHIVASLLESRVPVAVYVSPRGAHAGSAGTFIAAAANFAAMAPGTNIGAATPVSGSGEELPETLADKVTNDAAAFIRSIAEERGRNADKLEETVVRAASFTASEAVEHNVVNFVARDLDSLLSQLDGQTAETPYGPVTLQTADLDIQRVDKRLLDHFLEFISNPNIAFILLTIGLAGITIELFNFGLIIPGVIGVTCLLLAFLAFGNLPVNWVGVAFIVLAVVLVVLETQVAGWGALGVGGIVSLVIGGLLLFGNFGNFGTPDVTAPDLSVSLWVLAAVAGVALVSLGVLVWLIRLSRHSSPPPESETLVGESGRVTLDLDPRGVVVIGAGSWTAISEDGTVIESGARIQVVSVDGLTLTVARIP